MRANEQIAILVPDGAYPMVLSAFLKGRTKSIGLRHISFEIVKDAFRDSSREAVELLRPFQRQCSHALIIRDLHGSGWEHKGSVELEERLTKEMIESGWNCDCCGVVVVEPEIEAWLRFDSAHLYKMIRDRARRKMEWEDLLLPAFIDQIIEKHGGRNSHGKPLQPKEVFEELLNYFGIQRSNALYGHLAGVESLKGCIIPSFVRLKEKLQLWFPDSSSPL